MLKTRRLPPFLMLNGDGASGSAPVGDPPPAAPQEPAAPAAPAAPAVPPAPSAPVAAPPAAPAASPTPPPVPTTDPAEAARQREETAKNAASLLQLTAAIDNGITKDERALLTGTTQEQLDAQIAAILALRAPAVASARDAGITGAGAPVTQRAKTLGDAVAARINKTSN